MQIRYLSHNQLKPNPRNSKIHTAEQLQHIAESLKKFGWTQPVVVDEDYMILVGHGRVEAAKSIPPGYDVPLSERIPVVVREGLTPNEKEALCVADNKIQQETPLDPIRLDSLTKQLSTAGIAVLDYGLELKPLDADAMKVPNQVDEEQGSIKQLGIVFANDDFERVVDAFDAISKARPELENNTMVFLALLKEYEDAHS